MAEIHFLNVKEGDCTWIKHNDGKVTVIDVCNAYKEHIKHEKSLAGLYSGARANTLGLLTLSSLVEKKSTLGLATLLTSNESSLLEASAANYNQKEYPVNPITYLKKHNINQVFRFILTHPDMDHMDGLKVFFEEFKPINFWDTHNNKEIDSFRNLHSEEDWDFYRTLRDERISDIKRLTLYDRAEGKYYNVDDQGNSGGNGLFILAPSRELIKIANATSDYNDCSYVILYKTGSYRILFCGDSHNRTWEYILSNYIDDVKDIDLLIAPHHGRDSDRSYDFLDVLRPKLTFFGNATSKDLAYEEWTLRGLEKITNNQGNCLIAKINNASMDIFVTYQTFAEKYTANRTYFDNEILGWYIKTIAK